MIRHTDTDGDNLSKARSSQLMRTPIHEHVMTGVMPKISLTIPSVCVLVCLSCTAHIQPRDKEVYVRFPSGSKLQPNMFQVIFFLDAFTVVRKSPLN